MIPLLSSLAAVILAFFLYRYKPARALLRIFPAILIALLIINFTIGIKLSNKANPDAVLVDASPSMARFIASVTGEIRDLTFEHRLFFFSESTLAMLPDSGEPAGRLTNITGALLKASEFKPSSIILVSDGNHNYGDNPSSKLGTIRIPVFSFGVGIDTIRDIGIADAYCPEYVYQDDTVAIEVIVESNGFQTGSGELILRSSYQNIEQKKSFPLSGIHAKQSIDFKIAMQDFGEKRFMITIPPQAGEADYDNNKTSLAINVLERKNSILYYTDHLSFNTRFILNSIKENPHAELTAIARQSGDDFWDLGENRSVQKLPQIEQYDIVIMDNIKPVKIPWQNLEALVKMGKGLLFTGSIEAMRDDIKRILPIEITGSQVQGEFSVRVTRSFSVLSPAQNYPPFYSINRSLAAKPKSTIIATVSDLPAIAYLTNEKGVTFQINCVDLGNWGFAQVGLKNENVLSLLLSDIIRLLSPFGREHRLVMKTGKILYAQGEIANARLESYDRDFLLRSGGDFYLQYGTRKVPFFEVKPGLYDATFNADTNGDFVITAAGSLDTEDLTSNTVKISVAGVFTESEKPINRALLMEISEKTGGTYHSLDELKDFRPPVTARIHVIKRLGVDTPFIYLAIFILLVLDWVLRKKQGMI